MNNIKISIFMVGDIILDEPDAESYFEFCRDQLNEATFVIGHVEVPHTSRGHDQSTDIPAPPADPANLEALKKANFSIATLAGNHIHDCGREGLEDTVSTLHNLGIATAGVGMNINEARDPAIVEKNKVKIGVLSYNCVGPREGWATSGKAGCAYVKVLTHYELEQATPGAPPAIYTFNDPLSIKEMTADIKQLRGNCDILIVSLHKGVVHKPANIEMYEYPLSYAAIDAGADIVIGQHAHILSGIEIYHGKPIYHNLGNFVTVTHALAPIGNESPERLAWALKRETIFGFRPDPDMPFYPFHPESRNTMIARCDLLDDGTLRAGFIPCRIDESGRPHVLADKITGKEVVDYIEKINRDLGLTTNFKWTDKWCLVK